MDGKGQSIIACCNISCVCEVLEMSRVANWPKLDCGFMCPPPPKECLQVGFIQAPRSRSLRLYTNRKWLHHFDRKSSGPYVRMTHAHSKEQGILEEEATRIDPNDSFSYACSYFFKSPTKHFPNQWIDNFMFRQFRNVHRRILRP